MASNTTNLLPSQPQYGIKMAKSGFNVETANDYELLFNSAWPSIQIATSFVVTSIPNGVGTIPHGLGFPPFTMAWRSISGIVTSRVFPSVDNQNLYFNDTGAVQAVYSVTCYTVDISKTAIYQFIAPPPAQIGVYDPNWGMKFAKTGKSITSKDLNDYIFHSRAQSPQILAVDNTFDTTPAVANSQTITYVNPHNYIPWVFGYQFTISTKRWDYALPYAQAAPRLFINLVQPNSFTLSCQNAASASGGSLIVLRDPLLVAKSTRVVYG